MYSDIENFLLINRLNQLAQDKAKSRNHLIPTIQLALRRLWFYVQRYGDWTEHYLQIDNIKRDLTCFHTEVKLMIEMLEVNTSSTNEIREILTRCIIHFENCQDKKDFAIEYPIYVLREVKRILEDVGYDIKLLRSRESIDRQIKEVFDSLIEDELSKTNNFNDKFLYNIYALLLIVKHQIVGDFLKSRLSLAQYVDDLEFCGYSEADRDRIKLTACKLTSIPGINLKIARESARFLSSYNSRRHKGTLEYILRIVQSRLPAHQVNLYSNDGLMSKEDFLLNWYSIDRLYQEHPITANLQPGDIITLKEGKFVLTKSLVPVALENIDFLMN
jgi:hypothetical protein